ncbi:MAG: hypothetical protein ACLPHI_19855 [Terriglobales bacterium]
MKNKAFEWTARIFPVLLLASIAALAQNAPPNRFSGVINAYTPQTTTTSGTVGPYEVRGPWSLKLKGNSGKADFSAALNMELSDGWVITENSSNFDPAARGAHTHHITLCDGNVTTTSTGGLLISGTATITLNGNPAPVSPSPITIEISGGTDVEFSNITLTFGSPGSNHFGTEPLPGVVRRTGRR